VIEGPHNERIVNVDLQVEMRKAYLDYAMTVIVARALPDVRDGLKPVQRRILWTMHEMGLRSDRPYRKSAAIVGDVMGKYHPHGDVPIYDALARFAQDFTMRYPPIQGQGNFGCFSGDTKVELVNGEQRTFVELVEMVHRGVRAEVFTLDAHRNARIFRFERLGDLLGERQVDRGVVDDLALFPGRGDQLGRNGGGRRRGLHTRGGEAQRGRAGALQNVTP